MPNINNTYFMDSLYKISAENFVYETRLIELCLSMFRWTGLPDTVDPRYLELSLLRGSCTFFRDEVIGYLALPSGNGGNLNIYGIPTERQIIAANGYNATRNITDSVIIYNNYLHTAPIMIIQDYARRLQELQNAIDINIRAQKTPLLLTCDEKELQTIRNVYQKYDGGQPVIFGKKSLSSQPITAINTGAPYLADKLQTQKDKTWAEALSYLGILSYGDAKKERLITAEAEQQNSVTLASRYTKLQARQQACNEINTMFPDLNIWCEYNENFNQLAQKEVETDEYLHDTTEVGVPTTGGY